MDRTPLVNGTASPVTTPPQLRAYIVPEAAVMQTVPESSNDVVPKPGMLVIPHICSFAPILGSLWCVVTYS